MITGEASNFTRYNEIKKVIDYKKTTKSIKLSKLIPQLSTDTFKSKHDKDITINVYFGLGEVFKCLVDYIINFNSLYQTIIASLTIKNETIIIDRLVYLYGKLEVDLKSRAIDIIVEKYAVYGDYIAAVEHATNEIMSIVKEILINEKKTYNTDLFDSWINRIIESETKVTQAIE